MADRWGETPEERAEREARARAAYARRRERRAQDAGRDERVRIERERRAAGSASASVGVEVEDPRRTARRAEKRGSGRADARTEASREARGARSREQQVRRSIPGSVDYNNPPAAHNGITARDGFSSRGSARAVRAAGAAGARRRGSALPKVLVAFVIVALLGLIGYLGMPIAKQMLAGEGSGPLGSSEENLAVQDDMAAPGSFTVTFAGDCTLGTDANFNKSTSLPAKYDEVGDPSYFMKNVYGIFANDDLTIVNLEGTLTDGGSRVDKKFAFRGDPAYTSILTSGDIEAVSLANNHSKDYGDSSYTDTISALDAAGILNFGYDRIAYTEVQGVKVALIGTYELALGAGIEDEMVGNIKKAREEGAQVVLVYIHWGIEREYVPNSTQMNLGHAAIDAGADLVIGAHPHVIQGYEVYNGHYIVYSLGNFCFGGNSNPADKDCMIFQQTFTVTNGEVAVDGNVKVIPCSISSTSSRNNYQPTPAEGEEAERIMEKIEDSSEKIAAKAASM